MLMWYYVGTPFDVVLFLNPKFLCSIQKMTVPSSRPAISRTTRTAKVKSVSRSIAKRHRRNFRAFFAFLQKKHENSEELPFDRSEHVVTLDAGGTDNLRAVARSA